MPGKSQVIQIMEHFVTGECCVLHLFGTKSMSEHFCGNHHQHGTLTEFSYHKW